MKYNQLTITGHNTTSTHLTPLDKRVIREAVAWLHETGNQTAEVKTGRMKYHFTKARIESDPPKPVLLFTREWKETGPSGILRARSSKTALEWKPLTDSTSTSSAAPDK